MGYHGPEGLKTIAARIHRLTDILAAGLKSKGVELVNNSWFDTLTIKVADRAAVLARAETAGVNLRDDQALGLNADTLGISLSEKTTAADVAELFDEISRNKKEEKKREERR